MCRLVMGQSVGDCDQHVGIYASPDNWRTCYYYLLIIITITVTNVWDSKTEPMSKMQR